jgi:hypothetical protein
MTIYKKTDYLVEFLGSQNILGKGINKVSTTLVCLRSQGSNRGKGNEREGREK